MDREQRYPHWRCSSSLSHEGRLLRQHVGAEQFDAPGSPESASKEQMRKWITKAHEQLQNGKFDHDLLRSLAIDALLKNENSEVMIDAKEAQRIRLNVMLILDEAGLAIEDLQALRRDFPTDTEAILDLWEKAGLITKVDLIKHGQKAKGTAPTGPSGETPEQMDEKTLREKLYDARNRMFLHINRKKALGVGNKWTSAGREIISQKSLIGQEHRKAVQEYIALNAVYERQTGENFAAYLMKEGLPLYSDGSTQLEMQAKASAMDAEYWEKKYKEEVAGKDALCLLADPNLRGHWGSPMQHSIMQRQRWREEWDREGIPRRSSETSPTQLISGLGLQGREISGQEGVYDSTDYHSWKHSKAHREAMRGIGPGAYGPAARGRGVPTGEIPETMGRPAAEFGPYKGYRFSPYETRKGMREEIRSQDAIRKRSAQSKEKTEKFADEAREAGERFREWWNQGYLEGKDPPKPATPGASLEDTMPKSQLDEFRRRYKVYEAVKNAKEEKNDAQLKTLQDEEKKMLQEQRKADKQQQSTEQTREKLETLREDELDGNPLRARRTINQQTSAIFIKVPGSDELFGINSLNPTDRTSQETLRKLRNAGIRIKVFPPRGGRGTHTFELYFYKPGTFDIGYKDVNQRPARGAVWLPPEKVEEADRVSVDASADVSEEEEMSYKELKEDYRKNPRKYQERQDRYEQLQRSEDEAVKSAEEAAENSRGGMPRRLGNLLKNIKQLLSGEQAEKKEDSEMRSEPNKKVVGTPEDYNKIPDRELWIKYEEGKLDDAHALLRNLNIQILETDSRDRLILRCKLIEPMIEARLNTLRYSPFIDIVQPRTRDPLELDVKESPPPPKAEAAPKEGAEKRNEPNRAVVGTPENYNKIPNRELYIVYEKDKMDGARALLQELNIEILETDDVIRRMHCKLTETEPMTEEKLKTLRYSPFIRGAQPRTQVKLEPQTGESPPPQKAEAEKEEEDEKRETMEQHEQRKDEIFTALRDLAVGKETIIPPPLADGSLVFYLEAIDEGEGKLNGMMDDVSPKLIQYARKEDEIRITPLVEGAKYEFNYEYDTDKEGHYQCCTMTVTINREGNKVEVVEALHEKASLEGGFF